MTITPDEVDLADVWRWFAAFVRHDTGVVPGAHRVPSGDPRVVSFMTGVAAPALTDLGATVALDPMHNLVARFGPETGEELLFIAYPSSHHANDMTEPLRPRRDRAGGRERWVGLGASQGKAGLAALCGALRALRERGVELAGRVIVAVSSEGSSSHESAKALYAGLSRRPVGAVLTMGTGNRITLGNRGRIDIIVEIDGQATHSSAPEAGVNPLPLLGEVLARVTAADLRPDPAPHPLLGSRALLPYRVVCTPVAPHTIPAHCEVALDRRVLPGDDPAAAVAQVGAALADLPVRVRPGPLMLPALVDPTDLVVRALQAGAEAALGRPLATEYLQGSFDAGYGCAIGVPTVMCGPAAETLDLLGDDTVGADQVREATALYAATIANR